MFPRSLFAFGSFAIVVVFAPYAHAADIIVSAQDGKFVRVEGRATFPQPAPPDSLVVLDASQSPPVVKGVLEGLERTVQGPPQAVAVTPDGKLALYEIKDGLATKVNEVPGGEAAQGVVFSQHSKQILLQMDVERALGVYAIRDGKLVDMGTRIALAAGPVSIRSMPR
jgi:hypothetical protein